MGNKKPDTFHFWSFNRSRDKNLIFCRKIIWEGPFLWPGISHEQDGKALPNLAGVYLIAFKYLDGYILRSAGVTKSTKRRFNEHKNNYLSGQYTILDPEYAKKGIRKELWHGWGYAKEHPEEVEKHREEIASLAMQTLKEYRIFIAQVTDKRDRERLEFSIMHHAYGAKEPWSDLVDGGMALRGRFTYELPVNCLNKTECHIYGLPAELEI